MWASHKLSRHLSLSWNPNVKMFNLFLSYFLIPEITHKWKITRRGFSLFYWKSTLFTNQLIALFFFTAQNINKVLFIRSLPGSIMWKYRRKLIFMVMIHTTRNGKLPSMNMISWGKVSTMFIIAPQKLQFYSTFSDSKSYFFD